MNPMLDPERDLAGATPETLARALFRPLRGRPRPARQAVVADQDRALIAATSRSTNSDVSPEPTDFLPDSD